MTDWADWPTRRRIAALADGPQSGEAESGALIAAELAVFIERVDSYAPEAFPEAIETVVEALQCAIFKVKQSGTKYRARTILDKNVVYQYIRVSDNKIIVKQI